MQQFWLSLLLYVMVFATGAAGLIFQVTWQKYISRLLGSDSMATAIILGTFLGGLSVGYYVCGKLSSRIRNHFKAYAVLEGTVGIWCLLFPQIFGIVATLTRGWSFAPPVLMLIQGISCAAVLMGVPTLCMGGTIPFLTQGISRSVTEATPVHARVYATNTFGAFVGTLLAGFYLIPTLGLPVTIMGTAWINITVCLIIYFSSERLRTRSVSPDISALSGPDEQTSAIQSTRFPAWMLYLIALLSGFYVMTLENVLIRITNISVGSSSYSFSLIVAVFILAIAIGSSGVGRMSQIPRSTLLVNQTLITLCLLGIYVSLDTWPYGAHLLRIAFQSNLSGFWAYYVGLFVVLAVILLIPVALMGATIPLVFHELKRDLARVGAHSGLLFSWNTAGNLLGSLIGGIVFYYVLNNARVFLMATLFAACSAGLAGWYVSKKHAILPIGLMLVALWFLMVTPWYNQQHFVMGTFFQQTPWTFSFQGATVFFAKFLRGKVLFYKDDPISSVAVLESEPMGDFTTPPRSILVNGKPDSSTQGDAYTLKLSAHLPALFAPSRDNVMVIGLGTGVTAAEVTLYPDVKQLDIAEISPAVIEALPLFREVTYNLEQDPRVRIHLGDAFRVLGRSTKRWDVIISEPTNPWVTGVDLLFTQEFYQLVRSHLTDQGIFVQWIQLYATNPTILGMILNTLHQEFRFCRAFHANPGDILIIATNTPISQQQVQTAEQTLQQIPGVQTSLRPLHLDTLDAILLRELWTPSYLHDHFAGSGLQTMDNPRLHYLSGKAYFLNERMLTEELYTPRTTPYRQEYLLAQKYPNWDQFPFTPQAFEHLLLASQDVLSKMPLPTFFGMHLKAYLYDPQQFPLSGQLWSSLRVDLLPFVQAPQTDDAWTQIGLQNASFRARAEVLLDYVQRFRSWVVPFEIQGVWAVLQQGRTQGQDAYERNWCALQLASLTLQEKLDLPGAEAILAQISRTPDGTPILKSDDYRLLVDVNNARHAAQRRLAKE